MSRSEPDAWSEKVGDAAGAAGSPAPGPSADGALPTAPGPATAAESPAVGVRPRFSRAALVGLLGFMPVFGTCLLAGFLTRSVFPLVPVFSGWPELLITVGCGVAGALWTTACGIVGIVQILRSDGRLRGLWLANIEAVIWPAVAMGLVFTTVLACA